MATKHGLSTIKAIFTKLTSAKNFDNVMSKVAVLDGGNGIFKGELTVEEEHTNGFGTLHGGLTATLVDTMSTAALITKPSAPGVTVTLSVNYLKAARMGETIVIDAKTDKVGKTLAYLSVEIRNKETGSIVALGNQVKYIG